MHSFLIEEIGNKVQHLTKQNWSTHFGWMKAHSRIEGNRVADKLTKEAAQDVNEQNITYNRIPATTVAVEIKMKRLIKWQTQWDSTEKGTLCKSVFPLVPIAPEFTAIVNGNWKKISYLHRFKLADNPTCFCNEGEQSTEHIIYE